MNKKIIKLLQIIVSIVLIYFLCKNINIGELKNNIEKLNIFYIFIGFILFIPSLYLTSIRWSELLKFYDINIKNTFSIYWI